MSSLRSKPARNASTYPGGERAYRAGTYRARDIRVGGQILSFPHGSCLAPNHPATASAAVLLGQQHRICDLRGQEWLRIGGLVLSAPPRRATNHPLPTGMR